MAPVEKLLINGQWVPAASGATFTTLDPASGTPLAEVAEAGAADVNAAVEAATAAFAEWAAVPPAVKAKMLWKVADLIDEHAAELAPLETKDQGQPIAISTNVSIPFAAEVFRYYAGWATKIEGSQVPLSIPGTLFYTRREPIGVCGLITPWNFPFMIAAWKIAPALACGNTVIVKPAEQTPLSTLRLGQFCLDAGIPAGVVNIITGGPEAGKAIVDHPGVKKISFTGSTEVGKSILRASADNLTRVTLELGGKAPSIIMPDADLDAAVVGNLQGALLNSGQVCKAYTRFYAHSSIADEFAEKLAGIAATLPLGAGISEDTVVGPLVSEEQVNQVGQFVETAKAEGATLVGGGNRAGGALAEGFFFEPTVFKNVTDTMTIAKEEIFGPVLSVLSFDDEDDAIARANDTVYGLGASLWTSDLSTAHRMAAKIHAGTVYINSLPFLDPAAIHGGFGASGFGRELGEGSIDEFTEEKGVWIGGL